MNHFELSFGSIQLIEKDIAEVTINEGVEMDVSMVNDYHAFLCTNLLAPFSLLINKRNAYTYDFEAQRKLATIPEIHSMAVVTYKRLSKLATEALISVPRHEPWNIMVFDDRATALHWLQDEQQKVR